MQNAFTPTLQLFVSLLCPLLRIIYVRSAGNLSFFSLCAISVLLLKQTSAKSGEKHSIFYSCEEGGPVLPHETVLAIFIIFTLLNVK